MTHYRALLSEFIGAWDLDGRDRIVTITKVEPGLIGGQKGKKKDRKAILHFREIEKPMACNSTNAKTIAGLFGPKVEAWVGKKIAIYPTTTQFGHEMVDCIRVRPTVPGGNAERFEGKPVDPEMREKQDRAAGRADEPNPAAAITAAKTADAMLEAIRSCAAWIEEAKAERWPWVLKCAAKRGVTESDAALALQLATEGA